MSTTRESHFAAAFLQMSRCVAPGPTAKPRYSAWSRTCMPLHSHKASASHPLRSATSSSENLPSSGISTHLWSF
eukprot:6403438-Pyramimonas_sp.AAC.1